MKKTLLLLFWTVALNLSASSSDADSTKYSIHIIDYSSSWTSSMHYIIDDELKIEEVDNVDKKVIKVYNHRQLFGKEKNAIRKYISLFVNIDLLNEYVNRQPGDRNQKRINIQYGDVSKSYFISNTYQQDIAGLIIFLNSIIPEQRKMKEFVDPNKPVTKK